MERSGWLINTNLEVLLFDNLKTHCCLDASQDHCLINALGNRDIAIGAFIHVQSVRIGFLPELLVIERFKPFFNFGSIIKTLHGSIVANLGFRLQHFSTKGYTA